MWSERLEERLDVERGDVEGRGELRVGHFESAVLPKEGQPFERLGGEGSLEPHVGSLLRARRLQSSEPAGTPQQQRLVVIALHGLPKEGPAAARQLRIVTGGAAVALQIRPRQRAHAGPLGGLERRKHGGCVWCARGNARSAQVAAHKGPRRDAREEAEGHFGVVAQQGHNLAVDGDVLGAERRAERGGTGRGGG